MLAKRSSPGWALLLAGLAGVFLAGAWPAWAAAATDASGGVSNARSDDRTVSGTGWFLIEPSASNSTSVSFTCRGAAGPDALVLRFFATDGCVLYQGTRAIATAPGVTVGAPIAGTSGRAQVELSGGPLKVCWHLEAVFVDGESIPTTGCADSLQPAPGEFPTPREPSSRVTGSGGHIGDGLATSYYCAAVATPDAVRTEVVSCTLDKEVISTSTSGTAAPGPAALEVGLAFVAGEDPGLVCWTVRSAFVSGDVVEDSGCSAG